MKKLLSIAVVVALMLWFPILAQAKDNDKKNVEQYKYGKALVALQEKVTKAKENYKNHKNDKHKNPFVALQEQINDLEDTVYGVDPESGLQEQINAIQSTIDAIEEKLVSLSPASGSPLYTMGMGELYDISGGYSGMTFQTLCKPGDTVVSGGYKLRAKSEGSELPPFDAVYQVHNLHSDGWSVTPYNYGIGPIDATLEVIAVCFAQPAN